VSSAAIVPVRGFHQAKHRLSGSLDASQRRQLARELATGVLRALSAMSTFVVTDDDEVAAVAEDHHATVVADPGGGLNAAVTAGLDAARDGRHHHLIVAHADLPFPAGLATFGSDHPQDRVVAVSDRRGDGTNVLAIPAWVGVRVAYGPGSLRRHLAEAQRLGIPAETIAGSPLGWDVDLPEDLATPPEWGPPSWAMSLK